MQEEMFVLLEQPCRCKLTVSKNREIVTALPLGFTIHNQKPRSQRENDLLMMVAVNNGFRSVSC